MTFDIRESDEWIDVHKYASTTEIFEGEIGKLHGCRFVETTEAKVFSGEGCPSGLAVYATLFMGKDAFGMIDPEGGNLQMIIKDKNQAGGPLNQFSTLGYKFESATKILYQERMVRVESCGAYSAVDEAN